MIQDPSTLFTATVVPRTLKGACRLLGGTYSETDREKKCHIQLTLTSYLVIEHDGMLEIYMVSEKAKKLHKIVETKTPDRYVCTVATDAIEGPVSTVCNFEIDIRKVTDEISAPRERVVVKVSPIQGSVSVRHYNVGVVVTESGEPVEALMPRGGETLRISEAVRRDFVNHYRASVDEQLSELEEITISTP